MRIKITITQSPENSEDEFAVSPVQEQELLLIIAALRMSKHDDTKQIKLAKIVGGLISLGTDMGMKQFFSSQLKTVQRSFADTLMLEL